MRLIHPWLPSRKVHSLIALIDTPDIQVELGRLVNHIKSSQNLVQVSRARIESGMSLCLNKPSVVLFLGPAIINDQLKAEAGDLLLIDNSDHCVEIASIGQMIIFDSHSEILFNFDEEDRDLFTMGYCGSLVIPLRRKLGPDYTTYGIYRGSDDFPIHYLLKTPDRMYIDIIGLRTKETVLSEWSKILETNDLYLKETDVESDTKYYETLCADDALETGEHYSELIIGVVSKQ